MLAIAIEIAVAMVEDHSKLVILIIGRGISLNTAIGIMYIHQVLCRYWS
jgi:hypothetical protein